MESESSGEQVQEQANSTIQDLRRQDSGIPAELEVDPESSSEEGNEEPATGNEGEQQGDFADLPADAKGGDSSNSDDPPTTVAAADMDEEQAEEKEMEAGFAPVIANTFLWKGHIVNGIYLFLLIFVWFALTTPMTTQPKCDLYKDAALIAIIGDIVIMQPLIMGCTVLYRWMVTERTAEKLELESELHPLHGTLRQII